jgi:hypothetical protein
MLGLRRRIRKNTIHLGESPLKLSTKPIRSGADAPACRGGSVQEGKHRERGRHRF